VHHEHPFDVTVAMGGTLIGTRTSGSDTDSFTQGASHAVMAIGAFHQQIRPAVGYRIAVSYTRPGFQNSHKTAGISSGQFEVNSRIYELAATYVVQGPHRGGLSTSIEVGGGLMTFVPTLPNASISSNVRGAAVVGIAAEYALNKHVAIHAAYRGQVYKGPDFNYTGFNGPLGGVTLFSNEPMLGITYRFSHK
jgi:opacity protein-like surface antigen